jgi:hypothetical protein
MLRKLNCYVVRAGVFFMTAALIAGMIGCVYNPPPSEDLEIRTWYDLDAVRDNLAGDDTLMNDLDSTTPGYEELAGPMANGEKGWEPIGWYGGESALPFRGSLDGQGYEINDLYINRPDEDGVGLFGFVGGGAIKNVGAANVTVTGGSHVGGLVGWSFDGPVIINSFAAGNVTGRDFVAGLVGGGDGPMVNSYFAGNITGERDVGGLMIQAGAGLLLISNSYYDYDEVLINGKNIITVGALFSDDFKKWLANGKFLDVNDRLSQDNGYYVVSNVTDFKELLAFGQDATLKFRLTNDLDLATEPNFYIPYLAGEFDGTGHKISDLSFVFDFVSNVGLFGYLASGGEANDLGVEDVNVTGTRFVGGLAGLCWNGTVSNCHCSGTVTGHDYVGGLSGLSWSYVNNSCFAGNVAGEHYVGGLVGQTLADVSSSYSTGSVTGTQIVGGLIGDIGACTVSDSFSTSSVIGDRYVGGLVGWIGYFSTVSNSFSRGSVSGNKDVGGLVGVQYGGTISDSYSTGSVTGTVHLGGLLGRSGYGTVTGSFWDTQTSGQATSAGGMGKTTAEMHDIVTFSGAGWNIIGVALNETDPAYIWNIVNNVTYPFLSWQAV